jgi:hypothetical protein
MHLQLRRWAKPAIWIVIIIAIVGAILEFLAPVWIKTDTPIAAPKWIEDGRRYQTCTEAMAGTPAVKRVEEVSPVSAAYIGSTIIKRDTTLHQIEGKAVVVFQVTLVEKQFPDGNVRRAWVYGEGRVTDKNSMAALAEFVFIDAATGNPLLLIKNVYASDPTFTCGQLFLNY